MNNELTIKAYKSILGCLNQLEPLIIRIKKLDLFLEENGYISIEHQIPETEVALIDKLCFKSFNSYIELYPELEDEWIKTNLDEIKMTTVKGLITHFSDKKILLQTVLSKLKVDFEPKILPETKNEIHNYYSSVYNVKNADVVGENNQLININKLELSDKEELTTQLQKVIEYIEKNNLDVQPTVIKDLSNANEELKRGNNEKFISFLKKGGKWALDASTKVGTGLLTSYLKNIIGI